MFSSDCFSATHQATVTASSGTVNLSLWELQQRWKPRVAHKKWVTLRLTCAALTHGKHILVPRGKKFEETQIDKRMMLSYSFLFTNTHRVTRWSGWIADLPDRCSDPTSQAFPSIYPSPPQRAHSCFTGRPQRWNLGFPLRPYVSARGSGTGCTTENTQQTHTYKPKAFHNCALFFMTFNSQMYPPLGATDKVGCGGKGHKLE